MSLPDNLIYLDYAAATPMDDEVRTAMEPYFSDIFYNPSATYSKALEAARALESARSLVALSLGAKPSEINFTAGGSEANNLAIHGLLREHPGSKLVVSAIEHDSVIKPALAYDHALCPVDQFGIVKLGSLEKLIDDQTVLVSIMYINNEIGSIEPLADIAKLIGKIRNDRLERGVVLPLYLHSDAAQASNYLDLHISRLGVDLMTINGGKIYGPKQSGVLYLKAGIKLRPLIDGGGQEHGLRSGTESLATAVGLAMALTKAQAIRKDEARRLEELAAFFNEQLVAIRPDIIINGPTRHKIANNIHFIVPGVDNERLLMQLDQLGIMAAAGSACSASSAEPSHVLKAIGLNDEQARSSIRLTTGRQTTKKALEQTLRGLKSLL